MRWLAVLFLAVSGFQSFAVDQESQTTTTESRFGGMRINVGLLYSFADEAKYDGTTDGGAALSATEKTDPQFGLVASVSKNDANKLGFEAGLTHELERKFKSYDFTIGGVSFSGTYPDKPSISVTTLFVNANYTLPNWIYFVSGINFPFLNLGSHAVDAGGTLGFQVGAGYVIQDQFMVELQYRLLNGEGEFDNGTDTGDLDKIEFNGLMLFGKYSFM